MGRRRKSGNGVSSRQWLYVLGNFPYFWIVKIGISKCAKTRLRQIDKSAKGIDFILFKIKIRWAYQAEQFTHFLCSPIRVRFNGSGKTERFLFFALFVALPISLVVFLLEWATYIFGAVLFIWIFKEIL